MNTDKRPKGIRVFPCASVAQTYSGALIAAPRGKGVNLEIPEESPETLLLKMPVIGENLGQPFLAHRVHRNAINQAVAFVGAGPVELQAGAERLLALRKHPDGGIGQEAFDTFRRPSAKRLGCGREKK
jgi:hypothetical protein